MVLRRMTSKKESDEEVIRSCFAVFDQDRNGIISEEEFRLIFREIGKFPERNIDMIFKEVMPLIFYFTLESAQLIKCRITLLNA